MTAKFKVTQAEFGQQFNMEREYVVVVHKGVDLEAFDAEMAASTGNSAIPKRSVDVVNPRIGSKRMTHWSLTEDEVRNLRTDPRVLSVEIPVDQRDDLKMIKFASQTADFTKTTAVDNAYTNWGLRRCIAETNIYGDGATAPDNNYQYALDGTGVDIVIQDSGIEVGHPEWLDSNGVSRLQQINWYTASGLPGVQDANHYRDWDGHGTHCAGIAAGRRYGWAKGAHIYSQKLNGLEGPGDSGGIPIADAFDAIRLWHAAKTNGRPTVVNMSWGYGATISGDPTGGLLYNDNTGVMDSWIYGDAGKSTAFEVWQTTGVVVPVILGTFRRLPVRVPSVDAEIDDMIAAGIHICIASGNDYYVNYNYVDPLNPGHYNDAVYIGGSTYYYHRGSSPRTTTSNDDCFIVGNIDVDVLNSQDKIAASSTSGPAVSIMAPGTDIVSATSNINDGYATTEHPDDSNYLIMNISGTSMAAPQVAGVCAQHLQVQPNLTPAQLWSKVTNESKSVVYDIDPGTQPDYYNYFDRALYGSPNRMLYSKYGKQPITYSSVALNGSVQIT